MPAAETIVDAGPFDLAPPDVTQSAAALCLHGLTGTPYEVRPLGEALAARGVRAVGPHLPGHGETPAALAAIGSHAPWLDAARAQVRALRERHERVFVAGLSMGGLLALALAAEGEIDAAVVVGTPLTLPLPIRLVVPWAWRLRAFHAKAGGSDIRDAEARARHPSYPVMPLRSVACLIRLQREVRQALPRIRVPILVAHGVFDRTARPRDAETILTQVGSPVRERFDCPRSGHVVPVDIDGPELAVAAAEFLARHAAGRAASGPG